MAVYIDGFNLYHGIREAHREATEASRPGWKHCYWIDPYELARQLVPDHCTLSVANYFTARVHGSHELDSESEAKHREESRRRQVLFLDAVAARGGKPIEGVYSPKPKKCRSCSSRWAHFEEKMTDTRIAVRMVVDAMHDRFDTCVVISADADIVPPLESIRDEFPVKRRIVVDPPCRNSHHLQAMGKYFKLTRETLELSIMPNPVVTASGVQIHRPPSWK